jgi:hypothetical protein
MASSRRVWTLIYSINKRVQISDIPADSYVKSGLEDTAEVIREVPGLETFEPKQLVVNGYRSVISDGQYSYLSLPAPLMYEEFRAQLLANHLYLFAGLVNSGESLEQAAYSRIRTGFRNLDEKIKLFNDFSLKVGFERLVPVLTDGGIDDFINLGIETLGRNGLVRAKNTFDKLEHQAHVSYG